MAAVPPVEVANLRLRPYRFEGRWGVFRQPMPAMSVEGEAISASKLSAASGRESMAAVEEAWVAPYSTVAVP